MWDCSRHLFQKVLCDLFFSHRSCQLAQVLKKKNPYIGQGRNFKVKSGKYFLAFNFPLLLRGKSGKKGLPFPCHLPPAFLLCVPRVPCEEKKIFPHYAPLHLRPLRPSKGNPERPGKNKYTPSISPLNWISRKLFFHFPRNGTSTFFREFCVRYVYFQETKPLFAGFLLG